MIAKRTNVRMIPSRVQRISVGLVAALGVLVAPSLVAGPGADMYREFEENQAIYQDQAWQEYVQHLGERLLQETEHKGREYHFTVLDESSVNAFALPDGYIFMHTGLIAHMQSEDQLASVLGHEIAHVTKAHSSRRSTRSTLGSVAGFVAAVLTGSGELYSASQTAMAHYVSGYGREMELEADRFGAQYLAKAGYSPYAHLEMLSLLKDQSTFNSKVAKRPRAYHGVFSSHPKNDRRLHYAIEEASGHYKWEASEPVGDFLEMIDGLVYGEHTVEGKLVDNLWVQGRLRVAVQFPEGWTVGVTSNKASAQAPGGATIGHINMSQGSFAEKVKPRDYIKKVLAREDEESGESLETDSIEGYLARMSREDSDAKAILLGVVYLGETALVFEGQAGASGDAAAFEDAFRQCMESVRRLIESDLAHLSRPQIKVIYAEPGMTYAELADISEIRSHPEETLRLINGDYPFGEPRPGNPIKIVQ